MDSSQFDIMSTQILGTQEEILGTQDEISGTPVPKHVYSWLVLFSWTAGLKEPFQLFPMSQFVDTEIRPAWITSQLVAKSRIRKLKPLTSLPGQTMSLFAKMETGTKKIKHNYVHIFFLFFDFTEINFRIILYLIYFLSNSAGTQIEHRP